MPYIHVMHTYIYMPYIHTYIHTYIQVSLTRPSSWAIRTSPAVVIVTIVVLIVVLIVEERETMFASRRALYHQVHTYIHTYIQY